MGIKVKQLLCDYSNQISGSASWDEVSANCQTPSWMRLEKWRGRAAGKSGPSVSIVSFRGHPCAVVKKHQCLCPILSPNAPSGRSNPLLQIKAQCGQCVCLFWSLLNKKVIVTLISIILDFYIKVESYCHDHFRDHGQKISFGISLDGIFLWWEKHLPVLH